MPISRESHSSDLNIQALLEAATQVRELSYSPYSHFKVGAALLFPNADIVVGTNVENASYGLCICAERSAIVASVAQGKQPKTILAIAVCAESSYPVAPCGACLQVLVEFCELHTPCYMYHPQTKQILMKTLQELLPFAFLPKNLLEI